MSDRTSLFDDFDHSPMQIQHQAQFERMGSVRHLAGEDDDGGEGATEIPSVYDSLADAFDEIAGAGEGDQGSSVAPAEPKTPAAPKAAKGAPGEARDEQGRFAKPGEAVQSQQSQSPNSGQGEPGAGSAIVPPSTWSATAKAKFAGLDPVVQQEVLRREQEMDRGRAQWQQGAERLNRLDAVLRPRTEQFRLAGIDDVRAIETLFAAQDFLNRDPVEALLYLGRTSGVNWQAFVGRLQGQPAQGNPQLNAPQQLPPQLQPMARQLETLTNWATQQQQIAEQARMQGHQQTVQQFASDPSNMYFENVKGRMSQLIRSGVAKDLPDAYSQACWADPEVRKLMLQEEQTQRQADVQAKQRAKAAEARRASGSITGSPSPGASPGGQARPQSVLSALSQAWDEHA
jgi:hypothetical protein